NAGEPCAVGAHPADIALQARIDDRLACHAERAQPVQNRSRKPCGGGEFRIRVQRIAVTAEAVQQGLLRQNRQWYLVVAGALRCSRRRRRSALAAEATLAAGEDRPPLSP